MNADDAGRVVDLSNQIATIQQILDLIDHGATITSMTLARADRVVPSPLARPASADPSEDEGGAVDELPGTEEGTDPSVGALTVLTGDLTYPPQMLASIRAQELTLWQTAYNELARMGITGVPAPPAAARR